MDLRERLEQKLRTTMIGSISVIEESPFGKLWGHGLSQTERTTEQKRWYEIWQQVRTKILNKGNNQLRSIRRNDEEDS